jgi:hypothetical protein
VAYHPLTIEFLSFLKTHPGVRKKLRAKPNRTFLYAGSFVGPMWKEVQDLKATNAELATKQTLTDVLKEIRLPRSPHPHLLAYFEQVELNVPSQPDGFILWRALSGIFASNAVGAVSFQIGSGITAAGKIFAATELGVLARNPKVNETTRDLLAYFQRSIKNGEGGINVGLISA